ncbi:hypothetical protein BDR07DRAFT_378599 [Suillus spraguei]|nr:hypothetical protein BDR07DRAFT_378599 [Suillus spraguei]
MATSQVTSTSILPITDAQLQQSSSATPIEGISPNNASIYLQSHTRSPPLTATSNNTQTTERLASIGMGPMSSSIHNGANLILDLIRTERQQAFEVGQRRIAHIQQQHSEYRVSYSHAVMEESTKRRNAEDAVAHLSTELARYTKGATEVQKIVLQARADATAAQNTASEAERAADEARNHLVAVQDALQQVGITVSRDDPVTSNTPKIILGTPWLELIPSQMHSSDTPLPDLSSALDGKPSSSLSPTQHLGSPLKCISFIKKHINHLSDTLNAAQNNCKDLESQRNQLQSDLCMLDHDRNELKSLKQETEDSAKMLGQWKYKLTNLENEIQRLRSERDDANKAQAEAVIALKEMRMTSAVNAATLKSTFEQQLQDQQRQADANSEKVRQALENSIEAKSVQICDLQSRIAATVDEWKGKYDALTKEHDSQMQLLIAERQKYKEYVTVETCDAVDAYCTSRESSVREEQIGDLRKRLEVSASQDVMTAAKVSRIEELEKELASIRAHNAKLSQEKDEAIALVGPRDAQIKELQEALTEFLSRKSATECAPKDNSGGSSEEKKARRPLKSSTPRDQIQLRAPEARPVSASTADQRSKQTTGPKKVEKLKSKSSSIASPGFSAARSMDIDSASSTDVEIISGPTPIISQGSNTKPKPLRIGSNINTTQTVDSSTEKTGLKRAADTNDSSTPAAKRPKLFLDSSASSVEQVAYPASSSPVSAPMGSRSATSSPLIAKPVSDFKFRNNSVKASTSVSSGGVTSSKAMASSPNVRTSQSATSTAAPPAGASDGGAHRRSGSVTSETGLAAENTLGAQPRARFLRHRQIEPAESTAGEATSSKKHAEFKNFNPGDVPAKEQPSGSSARSTVVSAEQLRNAQAAASAPAPPNREAPSASTKGRPSLLRQFSRFIFS